MQFQIVNSLQSSSRSSTGPAQLSWPAPSIPYLNTSQRRFGWRRPGLDSPPHSWSSLPTTPSVREAGHESYRGHGTLSSRHHHRAIPVEHSIQVNCNQRVWGRLQASRFPPEWNRAETQCRSARILSREIMLTAPRHCPQTRHRQLATHLAAH